jgi:hypothetical protein
MAIHTTNKDFWRFPEDRILISRLIKTPEARLEFSSRKEQWKINGKKVSLEGKTWGKFHELFIRIFREIRFAFQSQYKKNFYLAKDAIYRIHAEAARKEIEEEWHIDKRRKSLPFLDRKAQKARARMKMVLRSTEEYRRRVDMAHLTRIRRLDDEIEALDPLILALISFLKTKESNKVLNTHPRCSRLFLNRMKDSETEKLLRKAVKEKKNLESEKSLVLKRYESLIHQLEVITDSYQGESQIVKAAIQAISQSPLKPERPHVARKLKYE